MSIVTLTSRITERGRPEIEKESTHTRLQPIELQTENGFSIIRRCAVDKSSSSGGTTHSFIVRDSYGYDLDITVDITDVSVAEIIRRSRGRLTLRSTYWIACAERHLATYLWEQDDYPPDARITVDYLTPEDLDLARRWEADVPEPDSGSTIISTRSDPTKLVLTSVLERESSSKPTQEPIKFLTENGYSIVRRSEVNKSVTDSVQECRFLVESPQHQKREIVVRFGEELITIRKRLARMISIRYPNDSSSADMISAVTLRERVSDVFINKFLDVVDFPSILDLLPKRLDRYATASVKRWGQDGGLMC